MRYTILCYYSLSLEELACLIFDGLNMGHTFRIMLILMVAGPSLTTYLQSVLEMNG